MITTAEETMSLITINRDFVKKIYVGDILIYQQFLSNIKMSILDDYTFDEIDNILLGYMIRQILLHNAILYDLDNLSLREIDNSVL